MLNKILTSLKIVLVLLMLTFVDFCNLIYNIITGVHGHTSNTQVVFDTIVILAYMEEFAVLLKKNELFDNINDIQYLKTFILIII